MYENYKKILIFCHNKEKNMELTMKDEYLRRGRCYNCGGKLCLNCQVPGYVCTNCGILAKKIEFVGFLGVDY